MLTDIEKTVVCMVIAQNPLLKADIEASDDFAREKIAEFKAIEIERLERENLGHTTYIANLTQIVEMNNAKLDILNSLEQPIVDEN